MEENPWIPEPVKAGIFPKQAEFLAFEGREALYGGAAGGGKSVTLLVAALQYAEEPGYTALILRRTYKQLAKADSILSKAKEWLLGKVRYNGDEHKFTFPSGATLEFGHMDHEDSRHDYQGGAWSFVGVDEATQFTQAMIAYPRTRQRRPAGSEIPIRWRGASNPGGIGHDHVKERYVKDRFGRSPCTADRQFFPATLADNPHIDRDDYVRQLKESGVDGVVLDQLLNGDWDAVAGGRFKAEWFGDAVRDAVPGWVRLVRRNGEEVERFDPATRPRFQTCDPAASASTAADYFVLSTWCVSPKANLVWLACERGKYEIPEQVDLCKRSYLRHRPQFLAVEEVMGQRSLAQILRRSTSPVVAVRGVSPAGRKKVEHATAAIVLASSGRVFLAADNPAFPLDDVVAELTRFTGDDKVDANDDIVDTLSYAAEAAAGMGGNSSGGKPGVWTPKGQR